eukprot:5730641-Pyramimonas_sp.AAC.1
MNNLSWGDLSEFTWCDLYAQVPRGLDGPDWAGYSKKTRNGKQREKIAEAETAVLNYEQRRRLAVGGHA